VTLRVAALAALLLAGGCATVPPPAQVGEWPSRRAALQAFDEWTLRGRVGIAFTTRDDGFSGGINWAQSGEDAEIAIRGPMGGAGFEVHVEGERLTLSAGGRTYTGDDARAYIADNCGNGNMLPVKEMRYWLVGAPAPDAPHAETLGADQRLASLEQSGWQVRYDRYESVGALALPSRMEMTTEGLRLRVVVSDWRLPP
jgi:outer membrane lipoprotein LolB